MTVQEEQKYLAVVSRRVAVSIRREAIQVHNLNGKKSRQGWRQFRMAAARVDLTKAVIRHANRFAK